jgi:glycosyltransferase involved in cell wall biosynthesis
MPIILFVGSLIERKGLRYLLDAWSRIAPAFSQMQLILIGEGPQRNELELLARSLGITRQVQFLGSKTPAQVAEWMRRTRLFVLPSIEEGLGVVLLEALASGTPCIGSMVGGIPDVITPEVGTLVPPREPDTLANAIQHMLSNQERWEQFSAQARRRAVEYYSWDVIGKRLMSVYQSVLASTRKPA